MALVRVSKVVANSASSVLEHVHEFRDLVIFAVQLFGERGRALRLVGGRTERCREADVVVLTLPIRQSPKDVDRFRCDGHVHGREAVDFGGQVLRQHVQVVDVGRLHSRNRRIEKIGVVLERRQVEHGRAVVGSALQVVEVREELGQLLFVLLGRDRNEISHLLGWAR